LAEMYRTLHYSLALHPGHNARQKRLVFTVQSIQHSGKIRGVDMQGTKLLPRLLDDKTFILALRKVAIDFVAACEDRLSIPAKNSALHVRRLKVNSNFDA